MRAARRPKGVTLRCDMCGHFHVLPDKAHDGSPLWGSCDRIGFNRLCNDYCEQHTLRGDGGKDNNRH